MNCKDCPYFKIAYEPMMPFDMGLAVCTKHNLEVDFADRRKINKLVCIENEKEEQMDDKEIFEIVRSQYAMVNREYLNEQITIAEAKQKGCGTCKHFPPNTDWPCVDCDMSVHDRSQQANN